MNVVRHHCLMGERRLRMTYDEVADAAFIYLTDPIEPGAAVSGRTLDCHLDHAAVNASFDSDGRLLGIELLGVSRLLRSDALPDQ
jgi:uncharacterized protein YuzE